MLYLCTFSNFANNVKVRVLKQDALECHNQLVEGCTNFAKNRSHLKTLGCRSVTCSKVHAEVPKMIGSTLRSPDLAFGKWHGIDWADLESVWA